MPRGVRGSMDFDSKISVLDEKIEKLNHNIAALKSERQEIISKKQESEMRELNNFLTSNNLTIEDVISRLTPENKLKAIS